MSGRRTCIVVALLIITIALSLVQADANLYAKPVNGVLPGFGTNTSMYIPPTHTQKDEALQIASTSPLCKQYNVYPDESWYCGYATTPVDGHTVYVSKKLSDGGDLWITVDLNTGSIVSATHDDPPSTNAYPFAPAESTNPSASMLSMPSMFTSTPIDTENNLFNSPSTNLLTVNSGLQTPSTSSTPNDNSMPGLANTYPESTYTGTPYTNANAYKIPSFPFNTPLLDGNGTGTWGFGY